jgi:excisionase family DNA binding protein
MSPPGMYSLEQVADRLGLHVRTVRSYVRSGRLHAIRIGKQYRVSRQSLQALTGAATELQQELAPRARGVQSSSVIHIEAIGPEAANRVSNLVLGAANSSRDDDSPLRVDTIYDATGGSLKVIVMGSLGDAAAMFKLISAVLEM